MPAAVAPLPSDGDPNPFIRFRHLSAAWAMAQERDLPEHDYVAIVRGLNQAVAEVDGRSFRVTPFVRSPELESSLGLSGGGVWIKDETGHVAGSHKARHLFGIATYLGIAERTGIVDATSAARPLAIASCGNAALAAAVVARAARRTLRVFVPPWAEPNVLQSLGALGAAIELCPRRDDDPPGDPCHHRFRQAVEQGALPFCCQGPDNGLTIDGGMTLGFEVAEQSAASPLDRLFIQVGGGALASAVIQGLEWARAAGTIERVPAIHAVQTEGGFPLIRAWRRIARELLTEMGSDVLPGSDTAADIDASRADAAAAGWLKSHMEPGGLNRSIRAARAERSRFMWPWESEPRSAATGILDDETYDWADVVRGMLATGGWPVVASEARVLAAHQNSRSTEIRASATGTAGLAGAMTLADASLLGASDHVAILFTGVER